MPEQNLRMPDNLRIDISDDAQLGYWSAALQVSADKLRQAVEEVGPNVGDVCRKLHGMPGKTGDSGLQ